MKKILIIQNKRIGDVLVSSVIANNYKRQFPESEIHFMAYEFTHGVIQNNPNIDKIISINDKELKKFKVLVKTIGQIRKEKYDIIFDPYSKLQSRLMCMFSGAKQTIGNKSRSKLNNIVPYYTHPVELLKERTHICGKSIEDRLNLLTQLNTEITSLDYIPKIYLSKEEKGEKWIEKYSDKKIIVFGVLGSTPQKSAPYDYIAKIIDFILEKYDVYLLFNFAPSQKGEADKIYELCAHKDKIITDIYANNIRGFIKMMNQCTLLVSNEGGSVHIAKALNKPTFTIFSPYVEKASWANFEDGKFHKSIHLRDIKPYLFKEYTRKERKKIERDPEKMYRELTTDLIIAELDTFLEDNLQFPVLD